MKEKRIIISVSVFLTLYFFIGYFVFADACKCRFWSYRDYHAISCKKIDKEKGYYYIDWLNSNCDCDYSTSKDPEIGHVIPDAALDYYYGAPIFYKAYRRPMLHDANFFIIIGFAIFGFVYCLRKSKKLHINRLFWSIFGLTLPYISLIIIQFITPRQNQ